MDIEPVVDSVVGGFTQEQVLTVLQHLTNIEYLFTSIYFVLVLVLVLKFLYWLFDKVFLGGC